MKPTKKQLDAFKEVLQEDHETLDNAATAILKAAWGIYEERAAWVVVAQVYYTLEHGYVDKDDQRASTLVSGPYGTEGEAQKMAEALRWGDSSTGERCVAYVVPFWHGSAAEWFRSRRKVYERLTARDNAHEKFTRAMERRVAFWDAHGHTDFPEDIDDDSPKCPSCGGHVEDQWIEPTRWHV